MVLSLSQTAADTVLDALAATLDAGVIELLDDTDTLIARLKLSNPVAAPAADGQIEFGPITPGAAVKPGRVATGRLLSSDGSEVMTVDVSDTNGDGVIKLDKISILRGQEIKIGSFVISMP